MISRINNQFKKSLFTFNNKFNIINLKSLNYSLSDKYFCNSTKYSNKQYQSRFYASLKPQTSFPKYSKIIIFALIGCFTLYFFHDYKPIRTLLRFSRSTFTLSYAAFYLKFNWWYLDYLKLETVNPIEYKLRLKEINQYVADLMLY